MPRSKGAHLTRANREVIEDGVREGRSARAIARMIDVAPSTVTREVKTNRTLTEPKRRPGANLAVRCAKYSECARGGSACANCHSKLTSCKRCRTRSCIDSCPDFERKTCPATQRWPFVCPAACPKRGVCGYPKCRYDAADADEAHHARLVSSREGIDLSPEELKAMVDTVNPLVKQGQSFEAIWATHAGELPCGVRSAYNYQEKGLLDLTDLHLPRKARMKKRKRGQEDAKKPRIDREGRTYDDFKSLPLAEQARVVQLDSVEGRRTNAQDILSMHIVARAFQLYLPKRHADARATIGCLDALERLLGSPEAFEAIFGILLVDRGVEFDGWEGMERSCLDPTKLRARVYYCDAMRSNQKSEAERNHEQLRRILPKGRSDFDKLDAWDIAICCSHVNSYPSAMRANKCPFELLGDLIPKDVLDELGIGRVDADGVILKPDLMSHAVEL